MNISFEKSDLEKKYQSLQTYVLDLANKMSDYRKEGLIRLEKDVNYYLEFLYLSSAKIDLKNQELDSSGVDYIDFKLNQVSLQTISSGEYNRLRLALLSAISKLDIGENGILFLDEIDANLSGKESEAIAKVLEKLSKTYQIFAISHQIQLTSSANQHFLVEKINGVSTVKELNNSERVNEIARMISGENVTNEAIEFAKNIIKS